VCVCVYVCMYADIVNDVLMYRFNAAANTWTALSPTGSGPSPRRAMGFAATPDGMLYIFGGMCYSGLCSGNGNERGGASYTIHVYIYIMYRYIMTHNTI
jgi:hypothetical protein